MNDHKLNNILNLSPQERYGYMIRRAADFEEIWILKDGDRYLTVGDNDDKLSIPVFPEKEFADLLLKGEWANYSSERMHVYDFMDWLDDLSRENIAVAGFPNTSLNSVVVSASEIKNHLLFELKQYE